MTPHFNMAEVFNDVLGKYVSLEQESFKMVGEIKYAMKK